MPDTNLHGLISFFSVAGESDGPAAIVITGPPLYPHY